MGCLKLRYRTEGPERLRHHLHLVEGTGYFFFPAASAPQGTPAALQVALENPAESVTLRGSVWARPLAGGVWLELPRAAACLDRLQRLCREGDRLCTGQLVLAEPQGLIPTLCRLIDVGEGGARLAASYGAGCEGRELRVGLPEAGPGGAQLEAFGRIAWARDGEVGAIWDRGDLASRAAVLRLVQIAEDDWAAAPTASHPASCRCTSVRSPKVVLLG
jgi:hypothetical protein